MMRHLHMQEQPLKLLPVRRWPSLTKNSEELHQAWNTKPSYSATILRFLGLGLRLPLESRMFDIGRCTMDLVTVTANVEIEGVNSIGDAFALPMRYRSLQLRAPAVHRHSVVRGPWALPKGGKPAVVASLLVLCIPLALFVLAVVDTLVGRGPWGTGARERPPPTGAAPSCAALVLLVAMPAIAEPHLAVVPAPTPRVAAPPLPTTPLPRLRLPAPPPMNAPPTALRLRRATWWASSPAAPI